MFHVVASRTKEWCATQWRSFGKKFTGNMGNFCQFIQLLPIFVLDPVAQARGGFHEWKYERSEDSLDDLHCSNLLRMELCRQTQKDRTKQIVSYRWLKMSPRWTSQVALPKLYGLFQDSCFRINELQLPQAKLAKALARSWLIYLADWLWWLFWSWEEPDLVTGLEHARCRHADIEQWLPPRGLEQVFPFLLQRSFVSWNELDLVCDGFGARALCRHAETEQRRHVYRSCVMLGHPGNW